MFQEVPEGRAAPIDLKGRVRVVVTPEMAKQHYWLNQHGCPLYHALINAGVDVVKVYDEGYYYRDSRGSVFQHPVSYGQEMHRQVCQQGKPFVHWHRDEPSLWARVKSLWG